MTIDTRNMLGCTDIDAVNHHVNERLKKLVGEQIPSMPKDEIYGWMSGIRDLLKKFGPHQTRKLLVDAGITGYFEPVNGGYEIAVYDIDAISEILRLSVEQGDIQWKRKMRIQMMVDNHIFQTGQLPDERPYLMEQLEKIATGRHDKYLQ